MQIGELFVDFPDLGPLPLVRCFAFEDPVSQLSSCGWLRHAGTRAPVSDSRTEPSTALSPLGSVRVLVQFDPPILASHLPIFSSPVRASLYAISCVALSRDYAIVSGV